MTTTAAVRVTAANLRTGDVIEYGSERVTVLDVSYLDGRLVEVHAQDEVSRERYIDFGVNEEVNVLDGPSHTIVLLARRPEVKAGPTATSRALGMVTRLKGEPTSAVLVLYALAAQEDRKAGAASLWEVTTAAGLAEGTTRGHLRTLVRKGLVREVNGYGYVVTT